MTSKPLRILLLFEVSGARLSNEEYERLMETDEDWFTGYPQEIEAFYRSVAYGEPVESDSRLAADSISTIYSAYVSAERKGAEVAVKTF